MDFPIDIVYLWVDDQDPQWIKEKKKAGKLAPLFPVAQTMLAGLEITMNCDTLSVL